MSFFKNYAQRNVDKKRLMSSWSEFLLLELEREFIGQLPSFLRLLGRHIKLENIQFSGTASKLSDILDARFAPILNSDSVYVQDKQLGTTVGDYLVVSVDRLLTDIINYALSKDNNTFSPAEANLFLTNFDALDWLHSNQYLNIALEDILTRY